MGSPAPAPTLNQPNELLLDWPVSLVEAMIEWVTSETNWPSQLAYCQVLLIVALVIVFCVIES